MVFSNLVRRVDCKNNFNEGERERIGGTCNCYQKLKWEKYFARTSRKIAGTFNVRIEFGQKAWSEWYWQWNGICSGISCSIGCASSFVMMQPKYHRVLKVRDKMFSHFPHFIWKNERTTSSSQTNKTWMKNKEKRKLYQRNTEITKRIEFMENCFEFHIYFLFAYWIWVYGCVGNVLLFRIFPTYAHSNTYRVVSSWCC